MRRSLVCVSVLAFLVLSGGVTSGTYQLKKIEAEGLEKSLQEQQSRYGNLAAEDMQLQVEVARLSGQIAALTVERQALAGERDALAAGKKGLEESLSSTSDVKNQKIAELSQKLGNLEAASSRLQDDVAQLQKQKEAEVQSTSRTYEDLLERMKSEISRGEVTISELKGKLTVNLVDSVLFDSGKAELKQNGLIVLQKVVDILKGIKDRSIRIEGHTDNVQIVGALTRRYATNWEFSTARAINVARYLQLQGIDPSLLAAVAYGEYKPAAGNDTDEGRAKNRRIEIVLAAKE